MSSPSSPFPSPLVPFAEAAYLVMYQWLGTARHPVRRASGPACHGGALGVKATARDDGALTSVDGKEAAALMGRYCDGETTAFHRLYQLTAPRVFAYLVGMVHERAQAEDLLQQTFMRLHLSRASYVRDANPLPWLYTIAHNLALDEMRRRKRSRVRLAGPSESLAEPRATLAGTAAEAAQDDATLPEGFSLALLDRLPQNQKEALLLTKVHGHSVTQAAAIAGTTPGALRVRAHRAYEALRVLLGRKGVSQTTEFDADVSEGAS